MVEHGGAWIHAILSWRVHAVPARMEPMYDIKTGPPRSGRRTVFRWFPLSDLTTLARLLLSFVWFAL